MIVMHRILHQVAMVQTFTAQVTLWWMAAPEPFTNQSRLERHHDITSRAGSHHLAGLATQARSDYSESAN
jgi:hypothetical protein